MKKKEEETHKKRCAICFKPIKKKEQAGMFLLDDSIVGELYLCHNTCVFDRVR